MRHDQTAKLSRECRIDSRIDTKTGEFEMVMATEGEASDGHIIRIAGLEFPDSIPLQLDHSRSVLANLGTVSRMRRDRVDGLPALRGVGQIRLSGDGEALEARRDLVDAIASGHVRGTSLTWDSVKATERRDLPRDHAAHVGATEKDYRKKYGLFFEKSKTIEQSIVGIPADREALIGRQGTATGEISRAMWDGLVERIDGRESRESEIIRALEESVERLEAARDAGAQSVPREQTPEERPDFEAKLSEALERIGRSERMTGADLRDRLGDVLEQVAGSR